MTRSLSRRNFMASSLIAGMGLATHSPLTHAEPFKTTIKKALITGATTEKGLMPIKEAGFEGVECGAWNVTPAEAEKGRAIAEKCGLRIHSVMRAWVNFNKPAGLEADIESIKTALNAAKGYGADTILMVPCKIGGMPMPQPWEFDIEYDEKTGHIKSVVKGDNTPYQKYIETHNQSADASREAMKKLIPTAEKTGVVIGVENVWNNMWVKPDFAAHFVRQFKSPWIQYYLDIGNHVKYAPPEEWVAAMGKMLVKLHIKDFKLKPDGHGGSFSNIREGSINWPTVRQALEKVKYNGWATIEGSGKVPKDELNKRLDLIIAGK